MTENSASSDPVFDDAPDLSTPYWQERFAKAPVQRGRPKSEHPKVSTTIRLSPEVVEHFRAGGPGWQSRIDEALREFIRAKGA
jgi:uncharacterized protein (DUF4415 family)